MYVCVCMCFCSCLWTSWLTRTPLESISFSSFIYPQCTLFQRGQWSSHWVKRVSRVWKVTHSLTHSWMDDKITMQLLRNAFTPASLILSLSLCIPVSSGARDRFSFIPVSSDLPSHQGNNWLILLTIFFPFLAKRKTAKKKLHSLPLTSWRVNATANCVVFFHDELLFSHFSPLVHSSFSLLFLLSLCLLLSWVTLWPSWLWGASCFKAF